jgi:4-hydroxy-3-methylbut-2-enyl diphosphate reductase
MKFSSAAASAFVLLASQGSDAFAPSAFRAVSTTTTTTTTTELASTTSSDPRPKGSVDGRMSRKKEDRLAFMKNPQYHRKGFKDVRPQVESSMEEQYKADLVEDLKTNNYKVEKEGVTMYLAKDFGFCWGVERSIALAYEAVEHYPDKKLHITNELIHNPEVNDSLTEMKVNLIEKESATGSKDFSPVEEGDVVILPAFGASYEEMEMLDKKVRIQKMTEKICNAWKTHDERME